MGQYNDYFLGIDLSFIIGSLNILSEEKDLPIVFLIDENHKNLNNCIDKNIDNAIELINKANVVIVGVESHSGGRQWDQKTEKYFDDHSKYDNSINETNRVSDCPDFANRLLDHGVSCVYGVECKGMSDKLHCISFDNKIQTIVKKRENNFIDEVSHLNKERSKHFIRTLFEFKNQLNLRGNLILNCGKNHNTHIDEWIKKGEIESITDCKANYIRLNAFENTNCS